MVSSPLSMLSDLAEQQLQAHARAAPGRHAASACLVLDAVAGIGFAAGLAGAVAALAAQQPPWGWLALLVLAAGLRGLLGRKAALSGQQAALAVKRSWRARLVQAALGGAAGTAAARRQDTAGGEAGPARLVSLAAEEIEALEAWVARFLPARQAATLAPLLVLAAVAIASPVTAAILAATLLPFIVLMAFAGRASAAESHRQLAALARLSGLLADRVRALPVVLAMRAEGRERARLATAAEDVAQRTLRVLRLAFLSSAVLEFFAALCVALVAVYCGFGLLGLLPFPAPERFALGPAFFVLALAPEFYLPMRRLAAAYHDRQAAQAAAERLLACESAATPALKSAAAASFQSPPSLCFQNVSLSHGDTPAVLQKLSFDLPAGQSLALMGPSGSGKTTVLRALLGLAQVREGSILLNGLPLAAAGSLAACAVWIGQQPLIVPGTLRENLLLAAPEASAQALAEAIERSGLQAMLAGRPLGLDTLLDARGGGLSGGERRRLALARALLKPGAWLWLLDEPTAHLDAEAEAALVDTLARACEGRTTLIATHSERLAACAHRVLRLGTMA
ncbi:thiol reductant ABC exporter subunit CydD [Ideonella azotifigens]|uniref:Thiol reductant ABC exporter subunit CydD n=2 Tax=Ideonella azotifigens TaxID=513160 RepID=A0ABP3V4U3_9BURK